MSDAAQLKDKLAELYAAGQLTDADFEWLGILLPRGVEELWREVELDGWVVAARVVRQGGRPAIAELRVFPNSPERATRALAGRWSENPEDVPAGGISTETLRGVQVGALRGSPADEVVVPEGTAGAADDQLDELRHELAHHPGAAGRPDVVLAQLAAAYVAELEAGNPQPVVVLARKLDKSAAVLRNQLRDARQRGLLTAPNGRRAGGHLTAKARRLLDTKEET